MEPSLTSPTLKRKRSGSLEGVSATPPSSTTPLPLTIANLNLFLQSSATSEGLPPHPLAMNSSPARGRDKSKASVQSTSNKGPIMAPNPPTETRDRLAAFGINIDAAWKMPEELKAHLNNLSQGKRRDPLSPNSKNIADARRVAGRMNEKNGHELIERFLLFSGDVNAESDLRSEPLIVRKGEHLFASHYLPNTATDPMTREWWGKLPQPKPDAGVGYVTRADAYNSALPSPFTLVQEQILMRIPVTRVFILPFITAQWKTPRVAVAEAVDQASREGTIMVNGLFDLYRRTLGRDPTVVESCHFSVVSNVDYAQIWVHYSLDGEEHFMTHFASHDYFQQDSIEEYRRKLHNIKEYAVNERLASIRGALDTWLANNPGMNFSTVPSTYSGSTPAFTTSQSSTMTSQTPSKKRLRTSVATSHEILNPTLDP